MFHVAVIVIVYSDLIVYFSETIASEQLAITFIFGEKLYIAGLWKYF